MIIGHYASALIPHSRDRDAPFSLLLLCAILQDALWLGFAALDWERTAPASVLDAAFSKISVEMTFSHDLVAALVWSLFAAALGFAVTRRAATAAWCAALAAGHELLDLLSGFTHHVAGPSTSAVGLNLYGTSPYAALGLEAAFGACVVYVYSRLEARAGRALTPRKRGALYALFVLGALLPAFGAERSLNDWLA